MTSEEHLRHCFVAVEVNADYSEATLGLRDDSILRFCHRVGERWVRASGPERSLDQPGLAGTILARISRFRLNAKHLEVHFEDQSRWELRFPRGTSSP
jgi:hypothetical protein